jgi:signal transduction histidine kinase
MKSKNTKKDSNLRISLRSYFTYVFVTTLIFSCLLSAAVVLILTAIFYHGSFTLSTYIVITGLICLLTVLIGSLSMWAGSEHLTRPLKEITESVKQIAEGDFTVHIRRNTKFRGEYQYSNEIDELAENVNAMTAELGSMDHMRKDFMHNVSHELKTPIASISGITELLLDGSLSVEEQKNYLELMYTESIRLSRLCENMLRISRFSNQQIVAKKSRIRLDEQLRKCVILLSESRPDKFHEFELDAKECYIQSDYDLLMQIWMNLLDNAMKFSPKGSLISIHVVQTEEETMVRIIDQGEGIQPEKKERIFEQFYQCEESHHKEGNGLGLALVKQIVMLLDGNIEYESEPKKGTTVQVKFGHS